MSIRATTISESGQFIVFDENNKIRATVTREIIEDKMSIKFPTEKNAIDFYQDNIDIALKNKETELTDGYYNSSITTSDFT